MTFEWTSAKQYSFLQILLAFAIPSAIAFSGFHFVLPALHTQGMPAIVAWPIVASTMLLGFVLAALWLTLREAQQLGIGLSERLCLQHPSRRVWLISSLVIILGLLIAAPAGNLIPLWRDLTGLTPPDYFPFFLNPAIDPMSTTSEALTPGFTLKGAYWLIGLIVLTLVLNILAEEFYFRAWLMPKMAHLGHAGWVLNGLGFALYHTFQLWLLPQLIPISLIMAFTVYYSRSILPALIFHLIVNSLSVVAIAYLIAS